MACGLVGERPHLCLHIRLALIGIHLCTLFGLTGLQAILPRGRLNLSCLSEEEVFIAPEGAGCHHHGGAHLFWQAEALARISNADKTRGVFHIAGCGCHIEGPLLADC